MLILVLTVVLAGCGGEDCVSTVNGEPVDCDAGDAVSPAAYEQQQKREELNEDLGEYGISVPE